MQAGEIPIFHQIENAFHRNIKEGRLHFTTIFEEAIRCTLIFLALPTPPGEGGTADLKYVLGVAKPFR